MRILTFLFLSLATFGQVVDLPSNIPIRNIPAAVNNNDEWLKQHTMKVPVIWSNVTPYSIGDTVLYNNVLYVAIAANTSVIPGTNSNMWFAGGSTVGVGSEWSNVITSPVVKTINSFVMNRLGSAANINEVFCRTDTGTVTLQLVRNSDSTGVTDPIPCSSTGVASTTFNTSVTPSSNILPPTDALNLVVSATGGSPTQVSLSVTYNGPMANELSMVSTAAGGILPTTINGYFNNRLPRMVTFGEVYCQTDTGTINLQLAKNGTNNLMATALTCDATGESATSLVSGASTLAQGDSLSVVTSNVTGTPTRLSLAIRY